MGEIARGFCDDCHASGPSYALRTMHGRTRQVWATDAAALAWNGAPPIDANNEPMEVSR